MLKKSIKISFNLKCDTPEVTLCERRYARAVIDDKRHLEKQSICPEAANKLFTGRLSDALWANSKAVNMHTALRRGWRAGAQHKHFTFTKNIKTC